MPSADPPAPVDAADVPANPLRYLARHWGLVVAGLVCLLLTNALAQSIPWVVKRTIEAIAALHPGADRWPVTRLALIVAALAVGQALIRTLSRILVFNAGRDAEYELRGTLFVHLLGMDAAFYRKYRTGDLMSRMTNDLSSVRALFGVGVLHAVNTVFGYLVALPLMLRIDPWLTLWALLPYPVLLIGARYFARGIYRRSRDLQVALSSMTAGVQEDIAGIREVKGYRLGPQRAERFARTSREYLAQAMRLAAWRAGLLPFVGLGAGLSIVLVLWLGGRKVISGDSLTLGDLVALNLYVAQLAWPTMAIGWVVSLWQRGIASWHRLRELLVERSTLTAPAETDAAAAARDPGPALSLRQLTVQLATDARPALSDVSFDVAPHTLCAVVGRVGCGKTTLAEAVARLLQVPPGSVLFAGRDVHQQPLREVRSQIAYAPQDAFLFSASVADNIAFGLPDGLDDAERHARIERAVRAAGLAGDVERLPQGLETVVGERGVSLSGGQRQRVALARALAAARPFLILDDSLSSVDAETERLIIGGLREVLAGCTTILISHRLAALQHADQVIVLDEGRVVERGRHEALLRRGGTYAQLYRQQLLQDEVAGVGGEPQPDAGPGPLDADLAEDPLR